MTIRELISILQRVEDQDRLVLYDEYLQGTKEVTTVEEVFEGGFDRRMSYERVRAVRLSDGNGDWMRCKHGCRVVGYIPPATPPVVHRYTGALLDAEGNCVLDAEGMPIFQNEEAFYEYEVGDPRRIDLRADAQARLDPSLEGRGGPSMPVGWVPPLREEDEEEE